MQLKNAKKRRLAIKCEYGYHSAKPWPIGKMEISVIKPTFRGLIYSGEGSVSWYGRGKIGPYGPFFSSSCQS